MIANIISTLLEKNWTEILGSLNANNGFNKFHSILVATIDEIAPETETKLSKSKTPRDPWVTKGMVQSLQRLKKLYLDQLHNTTISTKYMAYRNQLKKIMRKAKITHFKEKCKEYKQNSCKLWKLKHSILNKTSHKGECIKAINKEGVPRYDPATITDELCKHFSSIGKTFANKIPPSSKEISMYLNSIPQNERSIFLDPTNDTEIIELITKNSSGYDNLSNKLLKELPALIGLLTTLFNKSLIDGVFPETMKKADVVPLYKAKDLQESNNYRPISLLLTLSKLLEKIMYKRTYSFLESSGQIYKSQYGFRTAHSCENAICELVSEIIKGKQDGMYTLVVAFDSLEHDVLLTKMYKYGIMTGLRATYMVDR